MTMDKSAIEQIQQAEATAAARDTLAEVATATPLVALPDSFTVHDLEKHLPGRVRYRGKLDTQAIEDFIAYCQHNEQEGAACFVDADSMSARAFFNLGTHTDPGHGDFQAALAMQKTAPFRALLGIDGGKCSQKVLAEWLEDWRDYIQPYSSEGEAVEVTRAIAAVRRLTIEGSRKEDHDVQDFRASRSALETVEARSDHGMPAGFRFTCEPYLGLQLRSFEVRLSILTGGDAPVLTPRIRRLELAEQEMGQELHVKLDQAFATMDTYMGEFRL